MKKKLTWLLALVVMVVGLFALTACGSKEGVYKFYSMKVDEGGVSVELKAGEKFMGFITLSEDFMTIELKEDGSVTMTVAGEGAEVGTWKVNEEDSGKIDLTFGGETQTVECNGREIRMEFEGNELVLKK